MNSYPGPCPQKDKMQLYQILLDPLIPSEFRSSSTPPTLHTKGIHYSNRCHRRPSLHMSKLSQSPILNLTRYTK
ncbi:hypothetical protein Hanom_Chr13g01241501 [Helianthus anomalus]